MKPTRKSLIDFLLGRADKPTADHIAQELRDNPNGEAAQLFKALQVRTRNVLNVEWARLSLGGHSEDSLDDEEIRIPVERSAVPDLLLTHGTENLSGGADRTFPFMATALGESTGQADAQLRRRWSFEQQAEHCEFRGGCPESLAGQFAKIDIEWLAGGVLQVAVAGFLRIGKEYRLEIIWIAKDGVERVRGHPGSRFVPLVELRSDDRLPPCTGDSIVVHNSWWPSKGDGWEVTVRTVLP